MDTQTRSSPARKATRRTPTQKQIENLKSLDDAALIGKAVEAMHALNRRAKKLRDTFNTYRRASFARSVKDDQERIYALKERLLDVLLDNGAPLFTFEVEGHPYWVCECGHSWGGYGDECYRCHDYGQQEVDTETWYIVEYQKVRFHTPDVAERHRAKAVEIEPHDPAQPAREIPKVGLTIEAQFAAVELAIDRMKMTAGATPSPSGVGEATLGHPAA